MADADCLSDETMVDLVEGRVAPAMLERIEAHASRCATCRAVLSSLARGDGLQVSVAETIERASPAAVTVADKRPARVSPASDEPPARPSGLEVGARIGRYLVKRMLGAGGMGVVYAAHDPELDRTVAVKLLRPDVGSAEAQVRMQERLRREAQAMAQLAHPNVVAVYDVGTLGNRIFVAMEYVDGTTLAHWLAEKPRTHREILDAYIAAGRGLAAAHAEGLVHRDFKPENVVVGDDGRVRVLDFGLALAVGEGTMRTPLPHVIAHAVSAAMTPADLTRTGTVVGTPYYMAPEQYRGEDADARTDQFSFCVALYAAIYDQRPFRGETFDALCSAVLSGRVIDPPRKTRVPRRIRDAITRGLQHERVDRFPTMDALLAELLPVASRSRLMWAAPAVVLVAGIGAVAFATRAPAGAPPLASPACSEIEARLGEIWNDRRKAAMGDALIKVAPGIAADTQAKIAGLGDAYVLRWTAAKVDACAARPVRDATLACLDMRLRGLGEATRLIAQANPDFAANAIAVMHGLPDTASCESALPSASDPALTRQANELRSRLAELRVALTAGDRSRAKDAMVPLLVEAERNDGRLQAEASELAALVAIANQPSVVFEDPAAAQLLDKAQTLAGDGHAVRAAILVDWIVYYARLDRFLDAWALRGDAISAIAAAEAARTLTAREVADLRGAMFVAFGEVESMARTFDDAAEDLATGLRAYDGNPVGTVRAMRSTAALLARSGRHADALAELERVRELQRAVFGAGHPEIGDTLVAMAQAYLATNDPANAVRQLVLAMTLFEHAFGPDNRWVAGTAVALGEAFEAAGDRAHAIEEFERAVAIDDALKSKDPSAKAHLLRLAEAYYPVDLAKAHAALERSYRKNTPPGFHTTAPVYIASVQRMHAESMTRSLITLEHTYRLPPPPTPQTLQQFEFARDQADMSQLNLYLALPTDPTNQIYNGWREQWLMAEASLGLGEYPRAITELENSLHTIAGQPDSAIAAVESALGRALVDGASDRARGRRLVVAAWPRMASDPALRYVRERVATWMTKHGISTELR